MESATPDSFKTIYAKTIYAFKLDRVKVYDDYEAAVESGS